MESGFLCGGWPAAIHGAETVTILSLTGMLHKGKHSEIVWLQPQSNPSTLCPLPPWRERGNREAVGEGARRGSLNGNG